MKFPKNFAAAVVLAALAPITQAYAYDDKDVIDYRQHVMKALDEQTAAFGMVVSTLVENDNAISHLETIALTAKTALKSFEPKVAGGESKPEVWAQWKDFSDRMNAFAVATEKLVQTARTQGQAAMMQDMVGALACKGCHDVYRNKK